MNDYENSQGVEKVFRDLSAGKDEMPNSNFRHLLEEIRFKYTKEQLDMITNLLDSNDDDKISLKELKFFLSEYKESHTLQSNLMSLLKNSKTDTFEEITGLTMDIQPRNYF